MDMKREIAAMPEHDQKRIIYLVEWMYYSVTPEVYVDETSQQRGDRFLRGLKEVQLKQRTKGDTPHQFGKSNTPGGMTPGGFGVTPGDTPGGTANPMTRGAYNNVVANNVENVYDFMKFDFQNPLLKQKTY